MRRLAALVLLLTTCEALAQVQPAPIRVTDGVNANTVTTSKNGDKRTLDVLPPVYNQSAFGEQRTASPYTLLDLVSKYGRDPRALDTQVVGGGAVADVTNESAVRLSVTGASGDATRLRTNVYWRYQAGRGQRILQTLYLSANAGASANQAVRWGYFDTNDGLFWQRSGGVVSFCRRTSTSGVPVDNCAAVTIAGVDFTKGNIYEIGFQWLGVGIVRAWWNGVLIMTLNNPNTIGAPYMKTADLPLSWEIVNTGAADAAALTMICANVTAEGGQDAPEFGFAIDRAAALTVSTTPIPVLSISLAATFNGVDNRMVVLPKKAIAGNANQPAWVGVYLNPTLTGPAWVSAGAGSGVLYDVTATATTGGLLVGACYLSSATDKCEIDLQQIFHNNARRMRRSAFAGTSDILSVVSYRTSTVDAVVRASLKWTESP